MTQGEETELEAIYEFDYSVLNFIQEHLTGPVPDFFFSLWTHLGDGGIFCIAATVLLLCFRKTRRTGFTMAVAILLGTLLCNVIIKPAVARVRPYYNTDYDPLRTAGQIGELIKLPADWSFPSGHTAVTVETAAAVFSRHKKSGIAALAAAALVAFSRLYLYVHYFTDVLCGAIIGADCAVAAYFIVDAAYRAVARRIREKRAPAASGESGDVGGSGTAGDV